jgi:hypothetical protein
MRAEQSQVVPVRAAEGRGLRCTRKPRGSVKAGVEAFFDAGGTGTVMAIAQQLGMSKGGVYQVVSSLAAAKRVVAQSRTRAGGRSLATVWRAAPPACVDLIAQQPALFHVWRPA